MNDRILFERNLLALSPRNSELCRKLSEAVTSKGRYLFLTARNGAIVPAAVEKNGSARPLHSLVDPQREAQRLVDTIKGQNLVVLFGLGGGFIAEAALARKDINALIVVDFDMDGLAELFAAREYHHLLSDPRMHLLIDPDREEIERVLYTAYRPALSGGISVLPLRSRTETAIEEFSIASTTVKAAIETISRDYSVQAHFGKRWFSNTIRNILNADSPLPPIPPAKHIAITAAGPSLDRYLEELRSRRESLFILACDTSLPALLAASIIPDAAISIDCQHISYYHFLDALPPDIPIFLDLASPPLIARLSPAVRFFSGAHPLSSYIAQHWRPFPRVDSSGGNVSYAAVSLAELLGAETIELYGTDYSYPGGESYARGTYIHSLFQIRQMRLSPLQAQFSHFVFRNEELKLVRSHGGWRYETRTLDSYRQKMEEAALGLTSRIEAKNGNGAPINLPGNRAKTTASIPLWTSGKSSCPATTFLRFYQQSILNLPPLDAPLASYFAGLSPEERDIFTTLLPAAAAIRREKPESTPAELLEMLKEFCIEGLDRVLMATERYRVQETAP